MRKSVSCRVLFNYEVSINSMLAIFLGSFSRKLQVLWLGNPINYLCKASSEARPAGPLRRWWGSWRPPRPGLELTGRPWNGGSAPACEKKAAWAAAAGLLRAMNCAAIGLRPGGWGPNPLPKGDLSNRGSVKTRERILINFFYLLKAKYVEQNVPVWK
jgi:hypothetical protein